MYENIRGNAYAGRRGRAFLGVTSGEARPYHSAQWDWKKRVWPSAYGGSLSRTYTSFNLMNCKYCTEMMMAETSIKRGGEEVQSQNGGRLEQEAEERDETQDMVWITTCSHLSNQTNTVRRGCHLSQPPADMGQVLGEKASPDTTFIPVSFPGFRKTFRREIDFSGICRCHSFGIPSIPSISSGCTDS